VSTDPNDPIVDWSSLSWIVEDFHDRGRVLRLRYHDGRKHLLVSPGHPYDPTKRPVGSWDEGAGGGKLVLYLVIEEVFWEVKGQGKYREQEPPDPDCCMTRSGRVAIQRKEGPRFSLLVFEDSLSEIREPTGPDVCTRHSTVVGSLGVVGFWIQFLPPNLIALVQVAHWVIAAT